jgi:hypothetical protein
MAGLIHLELLTDFFNKIGPSLHFARRSNISEVEVATEALGSRSIMT